ncbi:MAG: dihydrofolate reductase [Chitinophagales bacterium]|jgi:dihydrofolate reductase|nr:dihydrofolate reductase [Chitinophagales bacterium]HNL07015.1 dihydrofolate reductase [Chitinophagales bacterium]
MIISLIAAATHNHVIGKNGDMPWHLPKDLAYFKRITLGHCIIMGRKTFESFGKGKALPHRTNIVMSRQKEYQLPPQVVLAKDLSTAIDVAVNLQETECFVIGGSEIYALALPFAHRIYMTRIDAIVEGDTFFPLQNWEQWQLISSETHQADAQHAFSYVFEVWENSSLTHKHFLHTP